MATRTMRMLVASLMATAVFIGMPAGTAAGRCTCNGKTNADGNGGADCKSTSSTSGKSFCYTDVNACQDGTKTDKLENAEFSFAACATCECKKGASCYSGSWWSKIPMCEVERGVCADEVEVDGVYESYTPCGFCSNCCQCTYRDSGFGSNSCASKDSKKRAFCYTPKGACQDGRRSTNDDMSNFDVSNMACTVTKADIESQAAKLKDCGYQNQNGQTVKVQATEKCALRVKNDIDLSAVVGAFLTSQNPIAGIQWLVELVGNALKCLFSFFTDCDDLIGQIKNTVKNIIVQFQQCLMWITNLDEEQKTCQHLIGMNACLATAQTVYGRFRGSGKFGKFNSKYPKESKSLKTAMNIAEKTQGTTDELTKTQCGNDRRRASDTVSTYEYKAPSGCQCIEMQQQLSSGSSSSSTWMSFPATCAKGISDAMGRGGDAEGKFICYVAKAGRSPSSCSSSSQATKVSKYEADMSGTKMWHYVECEKTLVQQRLTDPWSQTAESADFTSVADVAENTAKAEHQACEANGGSCEEEKANAENVKKETEEEISAAKPESSGVWHEAPSWVYYLPLTACMLFVHTGL